MARRRHQDHDERFDEEAAAPAPDRTRVEMSPFAEVAPKPDRPRAESAEPSRRGRRQTRAPSVVVGGAPSRDSDNVQVAEDWEAPQGEYAEATRVGALPTSRPAPPRSHERVPRAEPEDEDEDWGDPQVAAEGEATRIAPAPRERVPQVQDDNATNAGPPISLEVLEGPDRGLSLPVRGGRMIIGRGDGCDFKLKDASTSRRHAELVAAPSSLVVRDLGSGNGTRVNGERVTEAAVDHGDKIAVGQTVLLVVDELKKFEAERQRRAPPVSAPASRPRLAPPPRRAPALAADQGHSGTARISLPRRDAGLVDRFKALPPPKRYGILGGGGLVGLLLIFALAGAFRGPPPPPPGPPPEEIEYDRHFEEGKKLLRASKYELALEQFKAAQAVIPKAEIGRYLEACERDSKATSQLLEAKALAAAGEYPRALEVLQGIDQLANAYEEAKELVKTFELDRIAAVKAQIERLVEEGDLEAARGLLASLPGEEARAVAGQIDQAERSLEADQAESARRAREGAARAKRDRIRRARQEVDQALAGVVRKIDSGDFEGAMRELDRVMDQAKSSHLVAKVRTLRKLIPKFSLAYREGISKYNGGGYEAAAAPLLRALTLYEDMDIDGKKAASLQEKVGKSMEMKGRSAMARQEYGTAAKAFRQALRFNPKATSAAAALQDIARKAKDVYLQGYVEKDRNPDLARQRFRQVLDMVPSDHEVYADAKRRLDDMTGP